MIFDYLTLKLMKCVMCGQNMLEVKGRINE